MVLRASIWFYPLFMLHCTGVAGAWDLCWCGGSLLYGLRAVAAMWLVLHCGAGVAGQVFGLITQV